MIGEYGKRCTLATNVPKVRSIIKSDEWIHTLFLMKLFAPLYAFCLLNSIFVSNLSAQQYDAESVSASPFMDVIQRTGKLDFKRTLSLSFKSGGYLTSLSVDEGDTFNRGDLLASLDTAELIATKNSTYAQLLQAKREVNRVRKLMAQNLSSDQELDRANTQVETTRAAYRVAFYNLEKSQVFAPFDGVVLERKTELGELQSPGVEVLKVASLQNNWVIKVALTGPEVAQVRLGQKVRVRLQHIGEVSGVVNRIPAIANTDGHLFTIDVLLPELELKRGIIAGQLADVTIDFTTDNVVYQVPISALMSINDQGQALVMVTSALKEQPEQKAFEVFKMDNQFIYLLAENEQDILRIVTTGWQNISLGNK